MAISVPNEDMGLKGIMFKKPAKYQKTAPIMGVPPAMDEVEPKSEDKMSKNAMLKKIVKGGK